MRKSLLQAGLLVAVWPDVLAGENFWRKLKTCTCRYRSALRSNPTLFQREKQTSLVLPARHWWNQFLPYPTTSQDTEHMTWRPALLRAAVKNHRHVLPVCDPHDYDTVIAYLRREAGSDDYRTELAAKALCATSHYDAQLSTSLARHATSNPPMLSLPLKKQRDLRYGETLISSALYVMRACAVCLWCVQQLQGAELSYNNLLDIDAGVQLVQEFTQNTATIIKHGNPCGVASGDDPHQTFVRARAGDARSAFGGVVVLNYAAEREVAEEIAAFFCECVAAPYFSAPPCKCWQRKNLRVIPVAWLPSVRQDYEVRNLTGAWLWQKRVNNDDNRVGWRLATATKVAQEAYPDLYFAQQVVKRVKSNAVVLVKDRQLLAAGGGQTSRIDALQLAIKKLRAAGHTAHDLVLASDGFFPFADWVTEAKECGVTAVIQPGGSQRDHESIAACDEHGIGMVLSGVRGFSH